MLTVFFIIVLPIFLILFAITFLMHIFYLVPFVPSENRVVKKMVRAAQLQPHQTVFDLGCGDGRLLFAAEKAKRGTRCIGFEIAPLVYLAALLRKLLARSKAEVRFQNFFKANLRQANVIFCYLIPEVLPKLTAKIKRECKKGTKIISNTFHIPGLKPSKVYERDILKGIPTIYVYKI